MQEFNSANYPKRYTKIEFPSYRYMPGEAPHPTRDVKGHSFNKHPMQLDSFDPKDWKTCEIYLYAIDLFNYGFWWEAHETLEVIWVACRRSTKTGLFVQGLIQIAAAQIKGAQGKRATATRMAFKGLKKMKITEANYMGIDVRRLQSDVKQYVCKNCATPIIIQLN